MPNPVAYPACAPNLTRDERFFAGCFDHDASDDGGRDEFDESEANRRSNSATRCVSASTVLAWERTNASNSSRDISSKPNTP
jgi:hypothetical protein